MPNIDGPHGFLTVILPLHTQPCARADGTLTSPAHAVREFLATLPTAQHSPACIASRLQSPFARSPVTHFARFAVIDGPAFNGRPTQDAILTALDIGPDLMSESVTDYLERPYLLFCADFDVPPGAKTPERDYLRDLWSRMPAEWAAILTHCEGWNAAGDALAFADYALSCQIETTMPFNDYSVADPVATTPMLAPLAISIGAGLVIGGLFFEFLSISPLWLSAALAFGCGLIVALAVLIFAIFQTGPRSAPWAAGLNLKTVLKSLYVQSRFTQFAIDTQGMSAEDLKTAFGSFVDQIRPGDLEGPTQPPGIVPVGGQQ